MNITVASDPSDSKKENITMFTDQPIKINSYEKCRWPYFLSLPLMWMLTIYVMIKKKIYKLLKIPGPNTNTLFFDGLGKECRKVKEYAASWRAMEIIYNHNFPKKLNSLGGILDEFYWHGLNCQALRNRYKLVKDELRKAILKINKEEIKILSLACGSGQVIIEVLAEFKNKGRIIKALLIDIDEDGLTAAKEWAKQYGVLDQIETLKTNLSNNNLPIDFNPDIIEMLGFLDYVNKEEAINFLSTINKILDKNGMLITCNINPNVEQYFIKWVINWPMVYRRPKDLIDLGIKSDFNNCRIVYEPLKIHGLLIAQK
jgi:SAM-dependent methyltransferase